MLTVCYINRQPGRGYHYSDTNACGESAASKKVAQLYQAKGNNCNKPEQNFSYRELGRGQSIVLSSV